jgi:hypothetical protein
VAVVRRSVATLALIVVALGASLGSIRERRASADVAPTPASATAVALLPLDADAQLELYGQPVASEVARALVAGGVDVVVVGPKTPMPERVRLVVDGNIKVGKGDAVILTVRIRDPRNGTILDTLSSTASSLENIDRAAADLSARVLPTVRSRLDAIAAAATPAKPATHTAPPSPSATVAPPPPVSSPFLLAVGGNVDAKFQAVLGDAMSTWARRAGREPTRTRLETMSAKFAVATVGQQHVDVGLAFEVLEFQIEAGTVPLAHAKVRVRIADNATVLFDRVVVTDTVVGNRGMTPEAMAARVADAVVAIIGPNIRRNVTAWSAR